MPPDGSPGCPTTASLPPKIEKRFPADYRWVRRVIHEVEDTLSKDAGVEVPSVRLGALVMEQLRPIDRVAYVRFASVYRNFQDAGEFQDFVDEMAAAQEREELRRNQVELPL